jgi:D-3-phosphoglycerate dehydrogenase
LRAGRWARSEFLAAQGLSGRMIGILGFDAAGRALAARAAACQMLVAAWSPALTPEEAVAAGVEYCDWPRDVARLADAVVVLPVGDAAAEQVVDSEFVHTLADGAALVHLGHPGAVDETALAEAVARRGIRVAVDTHASVPVGESNRFRSRLLQLPGVIGTHHVRSATAQAHEATAREVVAIVRTFLLTGNPPHALNVAERSPARWQLLMRVRDEVGVMASILEAIRADGINAEEIASHVFAGARAASCTISLRERPSAETLEAIRSLPVVLHLDVRAVV